MSVSSADLVIYGSAGPSEADGVQIGGAIDLTTRYVFDSSTLANALGDTVEVLSSSASDSSPKTCTVYGRNTSGSIVSEALTLNGTSQVSGSQSFERILKIVLSTTCVGSITIRKASNNSAICIIEPSVLVVRRLGYNISSDVSGGSARTYYEKLFFKNLNSTYALLNATISEYADALGIVTFDLEDSKGGSNVATNRQSAPATGMLGSFDNAAKACPGTDLGTLEYIGLWTKISLTDGASAAKSTWQPKIAGQTI